MRDDVRNRWPYLGLLPDQGGVPPCRVLGGINTIVALMVRVPLSYAGPDGNPEDALSYDVGTKLQLLMAGRMTISEI